MRGEDIEYLIPKARGTPVLWRPHATHQSQFHFHTASTFPSAREMDNRVLSSISKKIKQLANVVPKVDALGPEMEYIPKKIEVNKPMPDLKSVTCKIDNEGLEIVHLPKEVKVHKGAMKFDNLRTRIDNKGMGEYSSKKSLSY